MSTSSPSFFSQLKGFIRGLRRRPPYVEHSGTDLARLIDDASHVGDGVAAVGAPINGPDIQADTVAVAADHYVASLPPEDR